MISEKIQLLGAGLSPSYPSQLTLKSIPTASELDYVGAEEFQATMLDKIFPQAIEEKVDFRKLLEIDFHWLCRGLRFLNYGPYFTVNSIFCSGCGKVSTGEYQVDLRSVGCKMLPEGFTNDIVIEKSQFIDFNKDIHLSLLTIQQAMDAYEDKMFVDSDGRINRGYARCCYMINSIGTERNLTPVDVKTILEKHMSSADYEILKDEVNKLTDYGLRMGGSTKCPQCGHDATFVALVDDRFLRPAVGDIRKWASERNGESRKRDENPAAGETTAVRKHN